MEKLILCVLYLALAGGDFEKAVLTISGAAELEELSEDEMERYRNLAAHPLDLNAAGPARLRACGLFSPFQIVSLTEYRDETGDILSWSELALVSGFSAEFVEALKEFVRLESQRAPGQKEWKKVEHELSLRGGLRADEGSQPEMTCGIKYGLQWGEKAVFNWASRTTYSDKAFKPGTISAAWYGRGWLGKIVAGDYSARFGQGLVAWTGFSLSGYTTVQAFRRNASGLSPTSSFSSASKGLGTELRFGKWSVSSAYSFTEMIPTINVTRVGESTSYGLTATSEAISADWMISLPGWSLFGEAGWKSSPMGLIGAIWIPKYGSKLAVLSKFIDNKLTAAACAESKFIQASIQADFDYSKKRETYKLILSSAPSFEAGGWVLKPSLRISTRLKPQEGAPWRTDLRADADAAHGVWLAHIRFNALWCRSFAWLGYLEAGFKNEKYAVYARGGLFFVDNWDDRIYVYERDAPGSFNVPAMYGRGFSASLVAALKFSRRHALHARISATSYPWSQEHKPTRLEAKLQYTLRI